MTEVLHIITPCTRPENLVGIWSSISCGLYDKIPINWWVIFDLENFPEKESYIFPATKLGSGLDFHYDLCHTANKVKGYGGPQRSFALDHIEDGWITFIDDDSCVHPDYFRVIWPFLEKGVPKVFLYGQEFRNGGRKWFDLDDPCRHVEHSMITAHRSLIGDVRQPAAYDCDKQFIRPIYQAHAADFVIIPQILAYYNWLRDDGWSWKK